MSKKQAQQWLKEAGNYSTAYSGNTRTMYVSGITQMKLDHFALPVSFNLVAQ